MILDIKVYYRVAGVGSCISIRGGMNGWEEEEEMITAAEAPVSLSNCSASINCTIWPHFHILLFVTSLMRTIEATKGSDIWTIQLVSFESIFKREVYILSMKLNGIESG